MQQTLKFLVIFMGILIFAGMAVIGATIVSRVSEDKEEAVPTAPAGRAFGSIALGLPAGSTVAATAAAEGRLFVTVRLPDGGERIVVLDLASGATLGTIEVTGAR